MRAPRKRTTIAIAVIATFVLGLAASAAMDDDTVVNLGYDENSHFFFWNVTSLDYEPWLDALEGDDTAEADLETLLAMCGISPLDGIDPTTLGYVFDGETVSLFEADEAGEFDPDGEPVETGMCGEFTGAFVTGPAGQVNHGMFMKTFNALFEGEHRGCVARVIAQSSLGKGDQQVRPGDVDDESQVEPSEDGTYQGTAVITTDTTNCKVDKKSDQEAEGRGGPPEHVLQKFDGDHPKNRESKGKPAGTPGGKP